MLSIFDRGLNYGMAVFETILVVSSRCAAASYHLNRMKAGAKALGIVLPSDDIILQWWSRAAADCDTPSVLKCLVTQGPGARGYASPGHSQSQIIITTAAYSPGNQALRMITATQRLTASPFATIKHNHKLAQVLAKDEALAAGADDAILLDGDGYVIEASSSNLLAWSGGEWLTPDLRDAGLPGTALARIAAQIPVSKQALKGPELAAMQEIYCCNAVIGVVPIEQWQGRRYTANQRDLLLSALAATQ